MPDIALSLHHASRHFRAGIGGCTAEVAAVRGVTLTVLAGESVGITGDASAGKTTLLMLAAGLLVPDTGAVRHARAAYVPPHGVEHPYLGVRASLDFAASVLELHDQAPERDVNDVLDQCGLRALARERVGTLTRGMQRRVAVAQALLASPELLCLDDPVDVLDAAERRRFGALLESLRDEGMAMLVTSRHPGALDGLTTRTLRMRDGELAVPSREPPTLELDVGTPMLSEAALATRLPSVSRRGTALRVALAKVSAEEVLAACLALGISVYGSRVIEGPAKVAEG
jgi:ABC-type multidrug transport system ATPase subunit